MPKQSYHRPYTVKYIIISTIKKNNKKKTNEIKQYKKYHIKTNTKEKKIKHIFIIIIII